MPQLNALSQLRHRKVSALVVCVCAFVVWLFVAALPAQDASSARADWPTYGGSFGHQRFSQLNQVNTTNASRLRVAWTFAVPDHLDHFETSLHTTPLVVRGSAAGLPDVDALMLITSPTARVLALNGRTGQLLWERQPELRAPLILCCSLSNRGVAFGRVRRADGQTEARVFVATPDARLWALAPATGAPIAGFGDGFGPPGSIAVGDNAKGYSLTMAPLFISRRDLPSGGAVELKDMVIVGSSGGEFETRGYVTAYDALTGQQLWRFFTIPAPGEFGSDTWQTIDAGPFANPYLRGGGHSWMTPAYEPRTGRLFFTAGNPGPNLVGTHRAGDNLFTNSVLALDVRTGKRIWHYQQVHHDLWDYDPASPPLLIDVGRRSAVAQAGKTGFFYILDRDTGTPIFACPETAVPPSTLVAPDGSPEIASKTQPVCGEGQQFVPITRPGEPVPTTGPNANLHPIFTPPSFNFEAVAPGLFGGSEWSPVAYHPRLALAFVSGITVPMRFLPLPEQTPQPGSYSLGGLPIPVFEKIGGTLTAMDVNAGKRRWQKEFVWPLIGGALATAGDLVFYGEGYLLAGAFVGLDAATGAELFRYWTKGGVNAAPMTYEAGGIQFVAVAAGGLGFGVAARDNLIVAFTLDGKH